MSCIESSSKTKVVVKIKLNKTSKIKVWLHRDERGYDDGDVIKYEPYKYQIVLNGKDYTTESDGYDMVYDEDGDDHHLDIRWEHYHMDDTNFEIVIHSKSITPTVSIVCLINGTEYDDTEIDADKIIAHIKQVIVSQNPGRFK